ncbi:MAG: NUDIX domain-containing protein [bacterium]
MEPRLEERSYGVVTVYRNSGEDLYLLVHQHNDKWSFPKGHVEGNESPIETARRELFEECAIADVEIIPNHTLRDEYDFKRDGIIPVHKINEYFIGFVRSMQVTPQAGEINECRFASFDEALKLLRFPENKQVLINARALLATIQ